MFAHGPEESLRLLRAEHTGICEVLNGVMGTKLWSSETAGSALNSWAISLALVYSTLLHHLTIWYSVAQRYHHPCASLWLSLKRDIWRCRRYLLKAGAGIALSFTALSGCSNAGVLGAWIWAPSVPRWGAHQGSSQSAWCPEMLKKIGQKGDCYWVELFSPCLLSLLNEEQTETLWSAWFLLSIQNKQYYLRTCVCCLTQEKTNIITRSHHRFIIISFREEESKV